MKGKEFVNIIRAKHQGHLMRKKLRALHYAAQVFIGIEVGAWSVSSEISFLVEKLRLIKRQVCNDDNDLLNCHTSSPFDIITLSLNSQAFYGVETPLAILQNHKRQFPDAVFPVTLQ